MPDLDLLRKSELWVVGVRLSGVNLTAVAKVAARVLKLRPDEVFVTDVRSNHIVFDVIAPSVDLNAIAGREDALLAALRSYPGIAIAPDASVHSHGILGVVGAPPDQAAEIVAAASRLEKNLRAYVSRSAAILSTGQEVTRGEIEDTNLAAARELLGAAGYLVSYGGVSIDDEAVIAGRIAHLLEDGHGLILTTGGVGAEDKDQTIEALQRLVPNLATAVLASYAVGHGRHVKPHVRVGCGRIGQTLLVALPGPTREVRAALPVLVDALAQGVEPAAIAEAIADPIRALWRVRPKQDQHCDHTHRSQA